MEVLERDFLQDGQIRVAESEEGFEVLGLRSMVKETVIRVLSE